MPPVLYLAGFVWVAAGNGDIPSSLPTALDTVWNPLKEAIFVNRSMRMVSLVVTLVSLGSAGLTGAVGGVEPADAFPADVAVAWFELLYDLVKEEAISPPEASRLYGIAAVALYEAIVGGSRGHRSLVGQLNALSAMPRLPSRWGYHWPTVANSALAGTLRGLFPDASEPSVQAIDAQDRAFAGQFQSLLRPRVYARSVGYGRATANAILGWAASDGYTLLKNCPYTPPVGPGLWAPTPPAHAMPLQPCWGMLRPFLLTSGAECSPPTPPSYAEDHTSEFYVHASQVYTTSLALTEEQKTIAQFWADAAGATGTPPGHWVAIMSQIAHHDHLSLMAAAEGYARVGIAVADAFIGCWRTKYTHHLLRPVTYIQRFVDPGWLPFLTTPNFPEYSSGHSTQSAAVAAVLTAMFGIKAFTDTTHTDHGLIPALEPRTFTSFDEAAAEAAMSRIYGGIHFPFGSQNGLIQGRCIGEVILDRVKFTTQRRQTDCLSVDVAQCSGSRDD
jgi:hypothetical protein